MYLTDLIDGYKMYQDEDGYGFTQDSVLLANLSSVDKNDRVLDLGCGSGVLSLLSLIKKGAGYTVGIDVQPRLVNMANESARLDNLDDRASFISGDVKDIRSLVNAESFDKAVCNPPYFVSATKSSDPSPRELSRTESTATLDDFVAAAAYAVRFSGELNIVVKTSRLAGLMYSLKRHNLEPKKLILVYPKPSIEADTAIVIARKGGKEGLVLSSLTVMDENSEYTPQFKELYK